MGGAVFGYKPVIVKQNFFDLTPGALKDVISEFGKESYRAKQLYKWVYQQEVLDFDKMLNVSKAFREELKSVFEFWLPDIVDHRVSAIDGTEKFLFRVHEGKTVESVLIPSDGRLTLCISSEVGCNLGCKFCFTGKRKLERRLTTAEIVGQFFQVKRSLRGERRISNVVFMGMGEPLDNCEHVFKSIEILHSGDGLGVSKKKITVSTSGLVHQIPLVTESGTRLAVSLNGSNDKVRSEVMPINKKHNIAELLEACRKHCAETGDRVTFEYVLLKGVTDSIEQARELYKLTRSVPCKINIIPFNEHEGSDYLRPTDEQVLRFQRELIRLGAHVLLRKTMGRDIYAACGQLTSKFEGRPEVMDLGLAKSL